MYNVRMSCMLLCMGVGCLDMFSMAIAEWDASSFRSKVVSLTG